MSLRKASSIELRFSSLRSKGSCPASRKARCDKALEYYEKLKAECVDTQVSYEERVKACQDVIDALKEAYKTLDSKSVE